MKTFKSINIFYMKQYKKREENNSSLFKLIEVFKYMIMPYLNFLTRLNQWTHNYNYYYK